MSTPSTNILCPICFRALSQDDYDSDRSNSKMGRVHPSCQPEAMQQWADYENDQREMEAHEANQRERNL